jgi:hypothetical protein
MAVARGADALLGIAIDAPSDLFQCGHPGLDDRLVAAPAVKLTAGDGGAGSISGSILYYYSHIVAGFETTLSPASDALVITSKNAALSDILVSADARCTMRKLYRSHDGGTTKYWLANIYDNTSTTYTDSLAVTSTLIDTTRVPRTTNETSGNNMLTFVRCDSYDLESGYGILASNELAGGAGASRAYPGPITVGGTVKGAIRSGSIVPFLTALYGAPTVSRAGLPVISYTWTATTARLAASARSLTALTFKGGSLSPEILYGLMADTIDLSIDGGKIADDTVKLVGQQSSISGVATKHAGTGYTGTLVARGVRGDAAYATTDLYVKVTTAPTTGTFAVKYTMGSSGTYTGSAHTLYYDLVSKKQTKGGTQQSDWAEAFDDSGVALGFDAGENRVPYQILFTGDVTTLSLNDEFIVPVTALIPGGTGTGYTAVPVHMPLPPRFGPAHVTILQGGTPLEALNATVKLGGPKEPYRCLGKEARIVLDLERGGFFTGQVTISRRYNDRTWENILRRDTRAAVVVKAEGERILSQPGTYSAVRETLQITYPQMRVTDAKSPVGGAGWILEAVTLDAEQPDDSAQEFFTIVLYSSQDWQFLA